MHEYFFTLTTSLNAIFPPYFCCQSNFNWVHHFSPRQHFMNLQNDAFNATLASIPSWGMYEKSRFIVPRCGYLYVHEHPTKTNALHFLNKWWREFVCFECMKWIVGFYATYGLHIRNTVMVLLVISFHWHVDNDDNQASAQNHIFLDSFVNGIRFKWMKSIQM